MWSISSVVSLRGFFPKGSKRIPLKYRLIIWVILKALRSGKYVQVAEQICKYISLNLEVDRVNKTWRITSSRAWIPYNQVRNYEDILKIFKSNPDNFVTTEERDSDGHFRRFTVETRGYTPSG